MIRFADGLPPAPALIFELYFFYNKCGSWLNPPHAGGWAAGPHYSGFSGRFSTIRTAMLKDRPQNTSSKGWAGDT